MWSKTVWAAGILTASLALAGVLWVGMTVVGGDQGPQFQSILVEPEEMRFVGGTVTVRARLSADEGIRQVRAQVFRGDVLLLQLPEQGPPDQPRTFTYVGQFQSPGNVRPESGTVDYSIRLVAVDSAGREVVGRAAFRVLPPPLPPAPPQ
jgi:hypothetical protein